MSGLLYFLFFCSGISGLTYQVVWVRVFGNVFGNTIYSASLVIAVFMLGLGVGSYVVGVWADRRYARQPESLLRTFGYVELAIGAMGFGISMLLPHLTQISALVSSYAYEEASGWYVLSTASHLTRIGIAVVLLTPITLLMGGTLTLLIRHLVRRDFSVGGLRIALLYGVNTAGAAMGAFLTDFALVPAYGLRSTQLIAVFFNVVAGAGALALASRLRPAESHGGARKASGRARRRAASRQGTVPAPAAEQASAPLPAPPSGAGLVVFASLALALSGFAAMGMEIVWFRYFTILLGQFRAVFSLLLAVILVGIGVGSLLAGVLHRRTSRPAEWFMAVQGLFVTATLLGLALTDGSRVDATLEADPAYQASMGRAAEIAAMSAWARTWTELWFNARPILLAVGLPALLMGFSFPLGNAIIQRAERSVGSRAGILYLANTAGAVGGALTAGFLFLPTIGLQGSATILAGIAGLAVVPLYMTTRTGFRVEPSGAAAQAAATPPAPEPRTGRLLSAPGAVALAGSLLLLGAVTGLWLRLPSDHVITRVLPRPVEGERVLALKEGLAEVIAVVDVPGVGRQLFTNGHQMSSTTRLAQRYMRALAHIPLLAVEEPETVLVIGFGVGNTTHAAALHPSIRRVEVADLSKDILEHAGYFTDANADVLNDPHVVVYVNDGRHHLQMGTSASYDLITLEPPPIGYAGVGALYSREFYALARGRLSPGGYVSQWLPAYQVPPETTLAMVRAFVDVFPEAVLISGAGSDLLLLGVNGPRIEIDPVRTAAALERAPAVQADLERFDLGTVREIVGTFVGAPGTLAAATRDVGPVTDDRPIQEYGVQSLLGFGAEVPGSIVDLGQISAWCPRCFADGRPVPAVDGLDLYLALLERAYMASPADMARAREARGPGPRLIAGSAYLGSLVPETAEVHNLLGITYAGRGMFAEAIEAFRHALELDPGLGATSWHLGVALASQGAREEAIEHLRRAVRLDPENGLAHFDLALILLDDGQFEAAVDPLRAALRRMPDSADVHNNLGFALAVQGALDEAIDLFERALALDPGNADARRNLAIARQQRQELSNEPSH